MNKNRIDYSLGLRISFTAADKKDMTNMYSYPMYLQSGLGTTDLIAVAGYNIGKYVTIGTGFQLPVIQYNNNVLNIADNTGKYTTRGFRRQTDALLKLAGHYSIGKLKLNGGVLGIFHLANDYYKTSTTEKYILQDSKGTTINWNAEFSYALGKNVMFSFLFAQPLKTRKNIPDGLARSSIYSPKLTFAF